ncbi:hypothetical protein UlMin_042933 [Ulmus minor]
MFSCNSILSVFLFLSLFCSSQSQQSYLNYSSWNNCSINLDISKGCLCDGPKKSCKSFVTFRSKKPYNTAINIASLLGSEASEIASLNKISSVVQNITTDELVRVPISCTCSGNIFQHFAPYTFKESDTYFETATKIYQNLTTCQALIGMNYYEPEHIPVGAMLKVPVRCACPSENQTASGVTYLLTYIIATGDRVTTIGKQFGVSVSSILEANMLNVNSMIFAGTPLLVPLRSKSCEGSLEDLNCIEDQDKSNFPVQLVTLIGVGIGFALLCLFLSCYKLYQFLKHRKVKKRKEGFFMQNGGFLLLEKLSSNGSTEKAKLFTAEELQRATDNYNRSRFLGKGGYGTVYKGMLPDGSIVAVKRSIAIGRNQIDQFVNEVVILSQVNHRNIVKLVGCCLETETPLLVYEFISNGTLSDHNRLSIACDIAGALAYMHSAASIPIFHRDIKSSNIILDDKFNAKIADFGTSRSVPNEKTHLTTAVQGTLGYMDPGYFHSSQFTDKSDVYSYGEETKNLVATFITLSQENQLVQILDSPVAMDAEEEEIQAVAELATRCLKLDGKKRPSMKQVSMELERLRKNQTILEMDKEPESFRDEDSFMDTRITYTAIQ